MGLGAPGESRGGCLCCPQEPGERPGQVRGGRAHSGNAACSARPPPDTTRLESPPAGLLTRKQGAASGPSQCVFCRESRRWDQGRGAQHAAALGSRLLVEREPGRHRTW